MKLSLKLPLAFLAALLLLMGAALFGIQQLNQALAVYETSVAQSYAQERKAATMLQDFKVQVQEWKNVLLRGKDSAQRERYWAAFQTQERIVVQDASELLAELPPGPALDKVRAFSQAHERMGAAYRKGYEAFQAADHDPQAGDKAVQGMDREPSKLLDEAAELIAKASADTAGKAAQRASQATTVSLIVMLAVCAASVVGALLFSRSVVRTNANSVAGDPAKPRPGRRKRCCGRQSQATGAAVG